MSISAPRRSPSCSSPTEASAQTSHRRSFSASITCYSPSRCPSSQFLLPRQLGFEFGFLRGPFHLVFHSGISIFFLCHVVPFRFLARWLLLLWCVACQMQRTAQVSQRARCRRAGMVNRLTGGCCRLSVIGHTCSRRVVMRRCARGMRHVRLSVLGALYSRLSALTLSMRPVAITGHVWLTPSLLLITRRRIGLQRAN